jgi:hypothetical protein
MLGCPRYLRVVPALQALLGHECNHQSLSCVGVNSDEIGNYEETGQQGE